jgi:hypothetical protein
LTPGGTPVRRCAGAPWARRTTQAARSIEQSPSRFDPDRLRYLMQESASGIDQQSGHVAPRIWLTDTRQARGNAMICRMHTTPIPEPLADPTRDPEGDPLTPPSPGHHNDEPQRPEGPPDKDPV